ncbi:MAG: response regulator, partial [bacterium]|nr:response regulator [bacterium]
SYNNLGLVLDRYKKYDSARIYFEQGLTVSKNLGNEFGVAITTMNLGLNSYRLKDYQTAIELFDKSFQFFEKVGDDYGKTLCYYNYCRIYFDQGNLEVAADYGYKCYDLAKSRGFQNEIMDASEYVSKIEEKRGDYEQSLIFFKEATAIQDSLYSEQKNQEIGRLESKNELQQAQLQNEILLKDQEVQSKQLKRTYLIIVIVSLLLIGVVVSLVLYYRTNKKLRISSLTVKKQADRLQELDAYKSRFFANISHDLRTPISLISGYLKDLQEDDESYFTQKSSASITKGLKNVDRLIYLTEEIRDLILLEEGNLKLEYRRVKINKYLGFLIELFRSHAESSGLVLNYESDIEEEVVALDPNQLEKIIYNLVANSIKFTDEGSVVVKLWLDKSNVVIIISDTGRGISKEEQSKIFDRFYQLPNQEYQAKEGMGIGLFLVKELVELHNGTINIASTQEVGSTFKIKLPVNKEIVAEFYDPTVSSYITDRNELQEDDSQPIQQGTIYEGRSTILVVDDHPEVRDYIGNQLREDYNILFASNGIQALELLDKMNVNLVITDLMMPLMDGFELLKNIKNKYKMLPAMVVSARSTIKDTTEILGYGINDFISKPFDKDNFLLRVKNLIAITRNKIDLPFSEKDHLKLANNRALTQLHQLIETNMAESKVAINEIADKLCLSERQASRVIKSLTGKAPGEYVKDYKLVFAESLLKGKEISSASELAKMVGYTNVTHFNQAFEKRFGYRPSEIIKEN